MEVAIINPQDGIYPAGPDYVHAIEVRAPERLLFVSGTMGLDIDGSAPPDLATQLVLVWNNITRILTAAGMKTQNIVRLTSYLRDAAFAGPNRDARLAALGTHRVPTTAVVVGTLSPGWLIEIEVIAAA